jgi:general secretion pathway protein G
MTHLKLKSIETTRLKTSWFIDRRKIPGGVQRADRWAKRGGRYGQSGLTLLELLIVIAIIGILSGIAVPFYFGQVEKARVIKATAELDNLQMEITNFELDYSRLPATLEEIKSDGLTDPWGNAYRYLNFAALEGDSPEEEDPGSGKNKKGKAKVKKGGTEAESSIRLDPFNTPLNSDYDLYSCGKDGKSAAPIGDPLSEDDIVRGRDGAYIGPASLYEP